MNEIEKELKAIIMDMRLLQETCKNINFPWLKPRKYDSLTLQQAQDTQRSLIPRFRELKAQVTELRFDQLREEVELQLQKDQDQAETFIEVKQVLMNFVPQATQPKPELELKERDDFFQSFGSAQNFVRERHEYAGSESRLAAIAELNMVLEKTAKQGSKMKRPY